IPIGMPPLRDRRDDIPLLVAHFLQNKGNSRSGRSFQLTRQAMEVLCAYDWPGNVRELENAIERAVALCDGETVRIRDLPPRLTQKINASTMEEEDSESASLPAMPETALYPLQTGAKTDEHRDISAKPGEPFKSLKAFLRDQEVTHLNRALEMAEG